MYAELTLPLKTFTSLPKMLPDNWTEKILKTRHVKNPYIGESLVILSRLGLTPGII